MMGYTFAIVAVLVFIALFFLFRFMGGARREGERRGDYRHGTTYEEPQDEAPARDAPPPGSQKP